MKDGKDCVRTLFYIYTYIKRDQCDQLSLLEVICEIYFEHPFNISFKILSFIAYFYYILLLCVSTASPIAILMALLHR